MPETNGERIRRILLRDFRRRGGGGGSTRPFDESDSDIREILLNAVQMRRDEFPVIACVLGRTNWVLLTTQRVMIDQRNRHLGFDLTEIEDCDFDTRRMRGPEDKHRLDRMEIHTRDGQVVEVELGCGAEFYRFWSTIRMAVHMAPEEGRRRAAESELSGDGADA